jgi:hypothetical protein
MLAGDFNQLGPVLKDFIPKTYRLKTLPQVLIGSLLQYLWQQIKNESTSHDKSLHSEPNFTKPMSSNGKQTQPKL